MSPRFLFTAGSAAPGAVSFLSVGFGEVATGGDPFTVAGTRCSVLEAGVELSAGFLAVLKTKMSYFWFKHFPAHGLLLDFNQLSTFQNLKNFT